MGPLFIATIIDDPWRDPPEPQETLTLQSCDTFRGHEFPEETQASLREPSAKSSKINAYSETGKQRVKQQ